MMGHWRIALQLELNSGLAECRRFEALGVTTPARIAIASTSGAADSFAAQIHGIIQQRLGLLPGSSEPCGGPGVQRDCLAWQERSCRHVLVLVIAAGPVDDTWETTAADWLRQSGGSATIIPVLAQSLPRSIALPGTGYPVLRHCGALSDPPVGEVADRALIEALVDERPGVFVSYVRREAGAAADAIHDALTHAGFRVFLDRFTSTPGRPFPNELAEAMSSMGLVLLLDTPAVTRSKWTMWELAFARRYRLGPVGVSFSSSVSAGSPAMLRNHVSVTRAADALLPQGDLDRIVDFVRQEYATAMVARTTYYEHLVRLAANKSGGSVSARPSGVLEIKDAWDNARGFVLPHGRPGRLGPTRRIAEAAGGGTRVLAGDHDHLPPRDRDDLRWLAAQSGVELAGPVSVYRYVRRML